MNYTRAGKKAESGDLIDSDLLTAKYYENVPNPSISSQRVSFGTSGHRGTSLSSSFNEAHIAAISKAIAEVRKEEGISGPLFIGKDTHALSESAWKTAIEVLAAEGVEAVVDLRPYTPTPVVSRAIINHNSKGGSLADGIVVTPSHNPPSNGGFKYDSSQGGPASEAITARIAKRANELLFEWKKIKRVPFGAAMKSPLVKKFDYREMYVDDLEKVIDFDAIRESGVEAGIDPLSGASVGYWERISSKYGIELEVLNETLDPTWSFMTLDHDGKIRIDPSSQYAMAGLVERLEKDGVWKGIRLVCGTDPDADRFGIISQKGGVLNPNYFLAAAAWYLGTHRPWGARKKIGKTVVSSLLIDKVADKYCKGIYEVPTGFKWFVNPLTNGEISFAGEESAGLTLLAKDGSVWTTDKDGIVADLLAVEMSSKGLLPSKIHEEQEREFGMSWYERVDVPTDPKTKQVLKNLNPEDVECEKLGSETVEGITGKTKDGIKFGGIKISSKNNWILIRPSGTEDIYKIYAESFVSPFDLNEMLGFAQNLAKEEGGK